jgi:hypothetical protein
MEKSKERLELEAEKAKILENIKAVQAKIDERNRSSLINELEKKLFALMKKINKKD